ncbi:MAG: beta-ketoacyl synthase chain length factor [Chitinophagaceae bacterium]|nr:beta-ketoacyl synthase chain length factor [Chitinophagaceae bacterium]
MIYIHQIASVSPQKELVVASLDEVNESAHNVLKVVEPKYEGIPLSILRRMGKAVRMGVGTALPLINQLEFPLNGIVIGTANGGMEDCIKFLNQVIEFEEGTLTPTNFVQSTPNAIASQLSLLSANKGYNITHVNRGLAFENALLDVWMLLKENSTHTYLLGGVEEISSYNYNIDYLADWFKKEETSNKKMYDSQTEGTLSGEGSAMFIVNAVPTNALAQIDALQLMHTEDVTEIEKQLNYFLKQHVADGESIDLLLSGENGDIRPRHFFEAVECILSGATVARFKHLTGDFATASALALTIACQLIQSNVLPDHMIKMDRKKKNLKKVLIYNQHKGVQHSFILVSKP